MRRVLFSWHAISIYSYPAMLYLGLVFGIVAGNFAANRSGLDSLRVFLAMLILTVPALVGARLLFVATHWEIYRREPRRIWRRSEGGSALQGGLALMLIVSVPLLAVFSLPFGEFWDMTTFTLLIALLFTRVGCILNGCCCGQPTEGWLGLRLPNHLGVWRRRIPTRLLEAGLAALLLLGAVILWDQRPFAGAVFLGIIATYSFGRALLEPTRETSARLGALNTSQTAAAAFGFVAFVSLLVGWLGIY
jgi:phosphatidylglycerol---prolipoprotein diacylglyceryl transferase